MIILIIIKLVSDFRWYEMIERKFKSRTTEYDIMHKINELIATYP